MLLNDTLTVRVHDVRKPVLCLARDWCNKCSVHDLSLRCAVCSVVQCVGLVKMQCVACESRRDLYSRRDYFLRGELK